MTRPRIVLLGIAAVPLAVACGGASASPGAGGPPPAHAAGPPPAAACTEMACESGLRIEVVNTRGPGNERRNGWPAGHYRVELVIDGVPTSCEGGIPLRPCDAGPSFSCDGGAVSLGESGCAIPGQGQGIDEIRFGADQVQHVTVRVLHDGTPIGSAEYRPQYQRVEANGPGCGPVCDQAHEALVLK